MDKPEIRSGETFSIAIDAPVYEILDEEKQPYLGDELFENHFGMWRLQKKD